MNEPSQEQDTFVGSGLNSQGKLTLNAEQIHYLMGKLSSDEQKDLQDTMKQCTNEVNLVNFFLNAEWFARF